MFVEQGKGEPAAKSAAQILLDAATYIETHGWIRGRSKMVYAAPNGESVVLVCAQQAIAEAAGYGDNSYPIRLDETWVQWGKAANLLQVHIGPYETIPQWNDVVGRTKEEVIATLRAAAGGKNGAEERGDRQEGRPQAVGCDRV
jgi:hypothetical protein